MDNQWQTTSKTHLTREGMALEILLASLRGGGTDNMPTKSVVKRAFLMADEFLKEVQDAEETQEDPPHG